MESLTPVTAYTEKLLNYFLTKNYQHIDLGSKFIYPLIKYNVAYVVTTHYKRPDDILFTETGFLEEMKTFEFNNLVRLHLIIEL